MFDPFAYYQYDTPCKLAVSGFIARHYPVVEGSRYGIDLLVDRNGTGVYVECEVKCVRKWKPGVDFPFPTVTISNRKQKFAEQSGYFFVCNETLTDAVIVSPSAFMSGEVIRNIRGRGLEEFREIPSGWCKTIKL